jgi:hypothetical protein
VLVVTGQQLTTEVRAMQGSTETGGKKLYTVPQLTVHGTLEDITKQIEKHFGASDGFVFMGQGITHLS